MKQLVSVFILALLSSFLCFPKMLDNSAPPPPGTEVVRFISYNIWNGFDSLRDKKRMQQCADWLRSKDPEVVALQELCGFDEESLLQFAKMYGHSYAVIQKLGGYPVGITSKRPITTIEKRTEGLHHGFLHVSTYGVDVINIHLSPFHCDRRLGEAKIITQYMEEKKLKNALLMGDFNAFSPFDAAELEKHSELVEDKRNYAKQYPGNSSMRGQLFDYAVQSHFIGFLLEDAIRHFVPARERMSYPAAPAKDEAEDYLQKKGSRIDYIMVTQALVDSCVAGFVWNKEDTWPLSDHFPVGLDLRAKTKTIHNKQTKYQYSTNRN